VAAASGVLFGPLVGSITPWASTGAQGFHRRGGRRHGQPRGSIAASILVSLLEAYAVILVGYIYVGGQPLSPALAVVVPFIVLIVTLLFRPTGLFVPTPK